MTSMIKKNMGFISLLCLIKNFFDLNLLRSTPKALLQMSIQAHYANSPSPPSHHQDLQYALMMFERKLLYSKTILNNYVKRVDRSQDTLPFAQLSAGTFQAKPFVSKSDTKISTAGKKRDEAWKLVCLAVLR